MLTLGPPFVTSSFCCKVFWPVFDMIPLDPSRVLIKSLTVTTLESRHVMRNKGDLYGLSSLNDRGNAQVLTKERTRV